VPRLPYLSPKMTEQLAVKDFLFDTNNIHVSKMGNSNFQSIYIFI